MKNIFKVLMVICFIFLFASKTFCIPNDMSIYGEKPLAVISENFKKVSNITDHKGDDYQDRYATYKINEFFANLKFGKYQHRNAYGEIENDIKWLVLAKGDGKALLVSRDVITTCAYDQNNNDVDFANSTLKIFLNTIFYDTAFSNKEKEYILNYTPTNCKVFILSEYELALYMGLNVKPDYDYTPSSLHNHVDTARKGYYTFASYKFKSVSSGNNFDAGSYNEAYLVRNDEKSDKAKSIYSGKITKKPLSEKGGVRPAIWVSYSQEGQNKHDELEKIATDFFMDKFTGILTGPFGIVGDLISNGVSPDSWYDYVNKDKKFSLSGWSPDKYYKNGEIVKNDWVLWDKSWYYVGKNGKVEKSKWVEKDGNQCYINSNGMMVKNEWIDNKYYVDKNGYMLKNTTTPDGFKVNANGEREGGGVGDFTYSLNLDLGVKKFGKNWYYYIKSVKSDSMARKLGLKKEYKIVEIDGDDAKLNILFEDNYGGNDLIIQSAIKGLNETYLNNMSFVNITFEDADGKRMEFSKEEIIKAISN